MRKLVALFLVVVTGFLLWRFVWSKQVRHEDTRVEATVNGQVLGSPRIPEFKLQFAPQFTYVGGHRFFIDGVDDTEQHYWIEADEKKKIKRMFWIQYRDYRYVPDSYEMDIWGRQWECAKNTQVPPSEEHNPNADHARMRTFLRSKGYTWPPEWMRFRMITANQKEQSQIMIWYMEDVELLVTRELDLKKMESGDKAEVARSAYVRQDPEDRKRWLDWNLEDRLQKNVKLVP